MCVCVRQHVPYPKTRQQPTLAAPGPAKPESNWTPPSGENKQRSRGGAARGERAADQSNRRTWWHHEVQSGQCPATHSPKSRRRTGPQTTTDPTAADGAVLTFASTSLCSLGAAVRSVPVSSLSSCPVRVTFTSRVRSWASHVPDCLSHVRKTRAGPVGEPGRPPESIVDVPVAPKTTTSPARLTHSVHALR